MSILKDVIFGGVGKKGGERKPKGGFMKRFACIDLTSRKVEDYPISEEEMVSLLGGKGLATHILLKEMPRHADPLGEENVFVVSSGVLTATGAPTSARFNASAKSPLTGALGTCNCGGDFGIFMKRAGYDGIVIKGRADQPVYLEITEERIEIKDGKHLWGMDTTQAQAALSNGGGKLVIGPAGENLVKFAAVVSGHRVLGRVGLGAVMGSKNLKAITASGSKKIPIAQPDKFKEALRKWNTLLRRHAITGFQLPRFGTAALVNMTNATHTLPVRNFKAGSDPRAYEISGEFMAEHLLVDHVGCRFCPIKCGRWINSEGTQTKGPEYETIALLGANLENFDLRKIAYLSNLCDRLGMDTISAGGVLGFAMELAENGKLKCDLSFGKTDNLEKTLEDIAWRKGLGDELAEGSMRLAEKYGGEEYCMHSKGLDLPGYEPRRSIGHGLGYATANRGGCHLNGGYLVFFEAVGPSQIDPLTKKGKAELLVLQQNLFDAISTAGSCIFTAYAVIPSGLEEHLPPYSKMSALLAEAIATTGLLLSRQDKLPLRLLKVNLPLVPYPMAIGATIGFDFSLGDFLLVGERVYNQDRMFNMREGFTREDDELPARLTHQPQDPTNPDTKVPLDDLLPRYYKARGWDEDGVPGEAILAKLDLRHLFPLRAEIKRTIKTARVERLKRRKEQDRAAVKYLAERGIRR